MIIPFLQASMKKVTQIHLPSNNIKIKLIMVKIMIKTDLKISIFYKELIKKRKILKLSDLIKINHIYIFCDFI